MTILIVAAVFVAIVGLFVFAHLLAYDQREKPIHVYVPSPFGAPYYPESIRRFLAEEDET